MKIEIEKTEWSRAVKTIKNMLADDREATPDEIEACVGSATRVINRLVEKSREEIVRSCISNLNGGYGDIESNRLSDNLGAVEARIKRLAGAQRHGDAK